MALKRWQRTHTDIVYLSEQWKREAAAAPANGAQWFVLDMCSTRLGGLLVERRHRVPFARYRMWLLARRWSNEAALYPAVGKFGPALAQCAHELEIRSL